MGIHITVFRDNTGDCTNNGISKTAHTLCVVNAWGPFQPSDTTPAVILETHTRGCLRIVPAVEIETGFRRAPGHWMAGGHFGHTSDSRFTELCENLLGHRFYGAVAIHDRQE